MSPNQAFERDVPSHLQDDVMTMLSEAAHDDDAHSAVTILDRDQLNAINVRVSGIVEINGVEYTFQLEDGDRNGTQLLAWEDDKPFEHHVPTRWALAPQERLISDAVLSGKGLFLIWKWDVMAARPEIAAIVGKYAYDRHFAPGGKTEKHWRDAAAAHHFDIVTEEHAKEIRRRLSLATGKDVQVSA